jgi:hypothetical protein
METSRKLRVLLNFIYLKNCKIFFNIKRYFLNDMYFTGKGPVFIYIGEEGESDPFNMISGFWVEQAGIFVI